jgi:hypothetical protein
MYKDNAQRTTEFEAGAKEKRVDENKTKKTSHNSESN